MPPTPASEAEQPPTPTPATPVTPQNAASFAPSKADGQGPGSLMQSMTSAVPDQLAPQQQDTAMSGGFNLDPVADVRIPNIRSFVETHLTCVLPQENYSMTYNSDLNSTDILETFDFEQFLQSNTNEEFNFDPTFDVNADVEIAGNS